MTRRTNLAAALHEASGKKHAIPLLVEESKQVQYPGVVKPPSRVGKKVVAGHFDPAVIRQLKLLAIDNERSIQSLLSEAINDLFEKHNVRPIA